MILSTFTTRMCYIFPDDITFIRRAWYSIIVTASYGGVSPSTVSATYLHAHTHAFALECITRTHATRTRAWTRPSVLLSPPLFLYNVYIYIEYILVYIYIIYICIHIHVGVLGLTWFFADVQLWRLRLQARVHSRFCRENSLSSKRERNLRWISIGNRAAPTRSTDRETALPDRHRDRLPAITREPRVAHRASNFDRANFSRRLLIAFRWPV